MVLLNISYETLYVEFFSENIIAYLNDKRFVLYYGLIHFGSGKIHPRLMLHVTSCCTESLNDNFAIFSSFRLTLLNDIFICLFFIPTKAKNIKISTMRAPIHLINKYCYKKPLLYSFCYLHLYIVSSASFSAAF